MADAIISVVAARVTAVIEDQIRHHVNSVRAVEKEVLDLSEKLKRIRCVVGDAEKRGVNDQSVKNWLRKLEDTAYKMDDVLDEWNYALLKHKQKVRGSIIPSSCVCFKKVSLRRDTAKKIQNVKATLDQILREKDDFNFVMSLPATDPVPISWRVQSTSSIEFEKVYGRDEDKNKLVRKLMLNCDSQILSIVGMGGIGKTTLAQLVYNDTQVKDCFELRIWICVSNLFDVGGIARGIVDSVGKEIIPPNTNQLDLVLQKLRDSISGKKFLLVLDDVWTEEYNKWEPLKINLKYGAPTSKILVTTRNKRVAKMMGISDNEIYFPQQLTNEECWTVLRRLSLSGRGEKECGEFVDVGQKIARKCKGLPLAANVLGSLLQFKDSLEEWQNVLGSEIWRLEKAEVELFPHLLLSYNELSPALKHCFSYCAIYPKDSRIHVEHLIKEWIAQGYLGSVTENGVVELKGREYFNKLAMRCLFQDFEKSYDSGEQIKWCKMHDIVHDFAQFVRKNNGRVEAAEITKRSCQVCDPFLVSQVQEYRSLFWGEESPTNICGCLTSLRVFRIKWGLFGPPPQGMGRLIHLRWMKLSGSKLSKEDLKIICRLHFLQTLLLACCSLKEIPGEIGNLVDLRHLNLSSNEKLKELPASICSLLELQTLLLACCSLEEIPVEIGNLVHLRHLDLSTNKSLKELPESMCSLLELKILNIECCSDLYVLPEGIHRLEYLQHLQIDHTPASRCFPQGLAQLSGLHTLSSFHGGSGSNKLGLLKNFNCLTGSLKLEIHSCSQSDVEELAEDAREAELSNKRHIQRLDVQFYDELMDENGCSSLLWMEVIEALQPNPELQKLKIWGYRGSRLPHWMSSPFYLLKEISLIEFSEVSSLPPLGKLPFLEIIYVKQILELTLVGRELLGIETSSSSSSNDVVVAFPKLKGLTFSGCHKWWEWSDITVEEEESAAVSVMPCLMRLSIDWCEGLKKLPHRLLRKASSLQILSIEHSSELVKSYGDKDSCFWKSISQNNPQLQLQLQLHDY